MTIEEELRALAKTYSIKLGMQINDRIDEMERDDQTHFLIYRVLGVTTSEGKKIDVYQNKGRFLIQICWLIS
jgi:hypothetical protein